MFETLSDRLSGVFGSLTRQGALSDEDIATALREVRTALLEADVSLPVARDFVKTVADKARGQAVTKSVTPGQQVVKIVHDALIDMLRGEGEPGHLRIDSPPAPILMVGLQGSGKTTTTAKLARRLKEREGKRVLMASLDTRRPAAMEQLAILGAPGRRRHAAHRPRPGPRRHRQAGAASRPPSAATTSSCSTPPAACTSTTS